MIARWRGVPESDHAGATDFRTRRGQPPAVGTESRAVDPRCVPLERKQFLAARHIPHLDGLVLAGRGQSPAVWAERDAGYVSPVPLKRADRFSIGGVPNSYLMTPARRQPAAFGTEGHVEHVVRYSREVGLQSQSLLPSSGVPNSHRRSAGVGGRGQPPTVRTEGHGRDL
jgi:hypothetical protein